MLRFVTRFSVAYIALQASPCNMSATRRAYFPSPLSGLPFTAFRMHGVAIVQST